MAPTFEQLHAHYVELLQDEPLGLDSAACVTVVVEADVDSVVERLGRVVERKRAVTAGDFAAAAWERDLDTSLAWVLDVRGTVVLVEVNGWAGSVPEVLLPLAWPDRTVAGMYWCEANGANRLSLARGDDVESAPADGASRVDPAGGSGLASVLPQVREVAEEWLPGVAAGGLAAVGVLTGFRLTREDLLRPWPTVSFVPRETLPARPPGILGTVDAELALAVLAADGPPFREANSTLAAAIADAAGVAHLPAVRTFLAALPFGTAGATEEPLRGLARSWSAEYRLPDDGELDRADPAWRRWMAGQVLGSMATEAAFVDELMTPYSWFEAQTLLGERWPALRSRLLAVLRSGARPPTRH